MANPLLSFTFFFLFFVLLVTHDYTSAPTFQIPNNRDRRSHLQFYINDKNNSSNATAINVDADPSGSNASSLQFAWIYVIDDLLTEGPNPNSKTLGHIRGFYLVSFMGGSDLFFTLNFIFTDEIYSKRSMVVMGRDPFNEKIREPLVEGSNIIQLKIHHNSHGILPTLLQGSSHNEIYPLPPISPTERFATLLAQQCNLVFITLQLSFPYALEQNGVVERKQNHLLETAHTIFHDVSLPSNFWHQALLIENYLINMLPLQIQSKKSPFQLIPNKTSSNSHLTIFCCICFPWRRPLSPDKLSQESKKCIFIGCPTSHNDYHYYPRVTKKLHISRHVIFHKMKFSSQKSSTQTTPTPTFLALPLNLLPTPNSILLSTNEQSYNNIASSNTQIPSSPPPPTNTHQTITCLKSGKINSKHIFLLVANPHTITTTSSFSQDSKAPEWHRAMLNKFLDLLQKETWSHIAPFPHHHILACCWTNKTKLKPDSYSDHHKAQLITEGFKLQEFDIDYCETFRLEAKMPTVLLLYTIALHNNWSDLQLDVSNIFLYDKLQEDILFDRTAELLDTTKEDVLFIYSFILYY